jgi:hypothetical protein
VSTVLGLDVSTKTIGVALFQEENGKLLELTHITPVVKPKPSNSMELLYKKVDFFSDFISRYDGMDVSRVFIEEPLLNANNVYTVATLLRFNGMISKEVYDVLGIVPEFISSYDARAFAFPELLQPRTVNKKGGEIPPKKIGKPVLFGAYPYDIDKKMVIWEKVSDREPQLVWQYTKNNTLKKENFDMTDAYAVALGMMKKDGKWS